MQKKRESLKSAFSLKIVPLKLACPGFSSVLETGDGDISPKTAFLKLTISLNVESVLDDSTVREKSAPFLNLTHWKLARCLNVVFLKLASWSNVK